MIKEKPSVKFFNDGSRIWEHKFEHFTAKVYVPETSLPDEVINFGYSAPYLIYLENESLSQEQAKELACKTGLEQIASNYATSVVFISPSSGSWQNQDEKLYLELISNSKIHQYYKDGYAILNNRFTHSCDGYAIRGAIFRTVLIGKKEAADYIASKLLKKLTGDGLWGPADVCPTMCILENLSQQPDLQRDDIPIVSIKNEKSIDETYKNQCKHLFLSDFVDYLSIYNNFGRQFLRWGWDGELQIQMDFEKLGIIEEPCFTEIKVSGDNAGDDKDSTVHKIGYISYYNKNLFDDNTPVPLLLCFHGGGDSAKHIAQVSNWAKVAHDHNFLLICIENHINSTATEMMTLLEVLKKQYPVDSTRIYATGFSMGGCKTWDLYQEYPTVFAGLAPMDATFDVGLNVYGKPSPCQINKDVLVPIFYAGGEITPLPELPFQAQKCLDRMKYVFEVNDLKTEYNVKFDQQDSWGNKIWGISGDKIEVIHDDSRNSDLTMNYFASQDGRFYTVFASISGQGHECRYHTCKQAWKFISQFKRNPDGSLI